MGPSDRILVTAVALSLAIHLAVLFGTPRFDLGWVDDPVPPAPLEATLVAREEPPATLAPAPPARKPKSRPTRPAPAAVAPAQLASASLLDAPSPDGEADPGAPERAESPVPESPAEVAEQPAPDPTVEAPASTDYPLRRARLVYDLWYLTSLEANNPTKVGQVTHRWSHDGRSYQVESVTEAVGFLSLVFNGRFVQRSTGEIRPDGLQPAQYTLDRGRGDRTEVARFDWAERTLALAWKGESRTLPLPAAAQDPLSMMHQLYFLQPVSASGTVAVATSRKLYRSFVALVGEDTLATPLGAVRTLRFRRVEPDGAAAELWADLDRNLLPVRIRAVDRKGNVLDQMIREAELEPAEPAGN